MSEPQEANWSEVRTEVELIVDALSFRAEVLDVEADGNEIVVSFEDGSSIRWSPFLVDAPEGEKRDG